MANKQRLIDANRVIDALLLQFPQINVPFVQMALESIPTVDAVEVVRCKDCKHWTYDNYHKHHYCSNAMGLRYVCPENNFCSYGERRTNE